MIRRLWRWLTKPLCTETVIRKLPSGETVITTRGPGFHSIVTGGRASVGKR